MWLLRPRPRACCKFSFNQVECAVAPLKPVGRLLVLIVEGRAVACEIFAAIAA